MAVEGVDQRVEEGHMAIDGEGRQPGVVSLPLRQYLVGAATEKIDPATGHHAKQRLVVVHLLHLEAVVAQYVGVLPPLATPLTERLKLGQGTDSGQGIRTVGTDEADPVTENAEIDGEGDQTDLGVRRLLGPAVDDEEGTLARFLHLEPHPRLVHLEGVTQLVVAILLAGLLQRQPHRLPVVVHAGILFVFRAEQGKSGGRHRGG